MSHLLVDRSKALVLHSPLRLRWVMDSKSQMPTCGFAQKIQTRVLGVRQAIMYFIYTPSTCQGLLAHRIRHVPVTTDLYAACHIDNVGGRSIVWIHIAIGKPTWRSMWREQEGAQGGPLGSKNASHILGLAGYITYHAPCSPGSFLWCGVTCFFLTFLRLLAATPCAVQSPPSKKLGCKQPLVESAWKKERCYGGRENARMRECDCTVVRRWESRVVAVVSWRQRRLCGPSSVTWKPGFCLHKLPEVASCATLPCTLRPVRVSLNRHVPNSKAYPAVVCLSE